MPDYDNNMSGVLFKNDKKDSERHPDYKGNCEVDGVQMWLSAWIKTSRDGTKKFMSLSFELKEGHSFQRGPAAQTADVPISLGDFAPASQGNLAADDDIPF
jgi:hypothetical protein